MTTHFIQLQIFVLSAARAWINIAFYTVVAWIYSKKSVILHCHEQNMQKT